MGFSEIKIGGVVPFRNTQDVRFAFHGYVMKSKSSRLWLLLLLSCFDVFINKPERIRPFVPMDDR